jgi:PAS domain S-box-containing protein
VYPKFESTAVRKNGERFEVRVSACSVRNSAGQVTGTAAIIHDITKAKLAEKSLRDDEARFRMAFEHAPFGLCMTMADSRILQVNGTFCGMLGYSAAELTALGWLDLTHPDDRERSLQAYEQLTQGQVPYVVLEKRYLHKQGHTVWVRLRLSVIEYDGSFQFVAHVEEIAQTRD